MKNNYLKGEYVVYGNMGVCLIEDIKPMKFPHQKKERDYYILKPVNNSNSTCYVDCGNEELTNKMRYPLNKDEIDALILSAKDKSMEWIEEKNLRLRQFNEIISCGDYKEILLLSSCLYIKKQERLLSGKKLPINDENILKIADKIVTDEFGFSLNLNEEEVAEYIKNILD